MHPVIKPIKIEEFEVEQSKYPQVGSLPMRSLILAPSGGGKTILIQNMILDIYRNCFSRVYIFSPSVNVDATWVPVIDYLRKTLKQDDRKEQYLFDHYDEQALKKIIETQHRLVAHMKAHHMKKLFQILIVVDDFADDRALVRNSQLLHSLYIRGRHTAISTITSTQVYNLISPIIRKNATNLYVFKLRNYKDLEALLEELSALYDKQTIQDIYRKATSDGPHSFLYVNLTAKKPEDMFFLNLEKKIIPKPTSFNDSKKPPLEQD